MSDLVINQRLDRLNEVVAIIAAIIKKDPEQIQVDVSWYKDKPRSELAQEWLMNEVRDYVKNKADIERVIDWKPLQSLSDVIFSRNPIEIEFGHRAITQKFIEIIQEDKYRFEPYQFITALVFCYNKLEPLLGDIEGAIEADTTEENKADNYYDDFGGLK